MRNKDQVHTFEKHEKQLLVFLAEMRKLSEKKPNDAVNKFKLKYVNSVLQSLNPILREYKPFPDFETFDTDSVPTTSDVVMVLSQYGASLHTMRVENTTRVEGIGWVWIIGGKPSGYETVSPNTYKLDLE